MNIFRTQEVFLVRILVMVVVALCLGTLFLDTVCASLYLLVEPPPHPDLNSLPTSAIVQLHQHWWLYHSLCRSRHVQFNRSLANLYVVHRTHVSFQSLTMQARCHCRGNSCQRASDLHSRACQ
jgi:hypothetical protein